MMCASAIAKLSQPNLVLIATWDKCSLTFIARLSRDNISTKPDVAPEFGYPIGELKYCGDAL